MDLKLIVDGIAEHARLIGTAIFFACALTLLLRTKLAKRIWATLEETLFSNWQLALLGTTGVVLSLASGWTTWDGMRNFTGEPLLSGMFTFGIQGVMLIVAWLIGESFATGMNVLSQKSPSRTTNPALQTLLGAGIGVLFFIALMTLVLQWTGQTDIRQASTDDLSWAKTGDKLLIFVCGLLMIALFALYAASDLIRPYIQGVRVIVRNSVLWVMFLACMATSVFFSFDSLFTSIFPQSERVRAAELRAQNQVSGIIADINGVIGDRRTSEADALLKSDGWTSYETQLAGIAKVAAASEGAIERYINNQIETRRRAVKDQQERMTSAQSGQAGIQGRKISLTEEKGRLSAQRPELAGEYATKKAELDGKAKDMDAKRVEALAEDKGVEGTGKEGRGPVYRQRMAELSMLQNAYKIAEERTKDAQKRLSVVETRMAAIDRELANVDGDLAKLKGEAETAEQRIKLAEETVKDDAGTKIDPARLTPAFDRALTDFHQDPNAERLGKIQSLCSDIYGALSATPETKTQLKGLDCDPKATADAASNLFSIQAGSKMFEQTCLSGEKINANKSADDLFGFARRCLADSALPSRDTDALRTKINGIELARDDKAHRFVVTWNAFKDGNRLAYLALAIAIAIDGLVFMSGLFGANSVRSPLSDVPTYKARSASQLEATINAALGPQPYDTAWATLNALRPMTFADGFSAIADMSILDRNTADRVRMVLTAGADIGAVETVSLNPERYRVRSELREYLSSVCDRHFKTDATAKDKARLQQLVGAALEPELLKNADFVLGALEPIEETHGFTSMVTLSDIRDDHGMRVVRRVMNAGSAVNAVAPHPEGGSRFQIKPVLYETLLGIRATAHENFNCKHEQLALKPPESARDVGAMHDYRQGLAPAQRAPELPKPRQPTKEEEDEYHALKSKFVAELIESLGVNSLTYTNMDGATLGAATSASIAFQRLRESHAKLEGMLMEADEKAQAIVDAARNKLKKQFKPSDSIQQKLLEDAASEVERDWNVVMLLADGPYERMIEKMIWPLEEANADGHLNPDDAHLLRALKVLRQPLSASRRQSQSDWSSMEKVLINSNQDNFPKIVRGTDRRLG